MLKKSLPLFLMTLLLMGFHSLSASPYEIDDEAIQVLFDQAEEISSEEAVAAFQTEYSELLQSYAPTSAPLSTLDGEDQLGAIVLCFFLGGLGIHRVYLGGRGMLVFFYCITGGGCGVVTLVDFIILIVDGTSRFRNNNRFIAW